MTKKLCKAKPPKGWVKTKGATTAPKGCEWWSNGKSRFGGERKIVLVNKDWNSKKTTKRKK